MPNNPHDEELREQIKNYKVINETPVGTKLYPEDLDIRLHNLLSEKDIDNLLGIILAREKIIRDKYILEGKQQQWNKVWAEWLKSDDDAFDDFMRKDNEELWKNGDALATTTKVNKGGENNG